MDFDNRKVYGDTSITDGLVVLLVQVDSDKPRDLVVLNLDWSTREWELREYFEVGVRFFGIINI